MLTTDTAQPVLRTDDIQQTLKDYRRRRDQRRAHGQDVGPLEREIAQLERVLAAFTGRR